MADSISFRPIPFATRAYASGSILAEGAAVHRAYQPEASGSRTRVQTTASDRNTAPRSTLATRRAGIGNLSRATASWGSAGESVHRSARAVGRIECLVVVAIFFLLRGHVEAWREVTLSISAYRNGRRSLHGLRCLGDAGEGAREGLRVDCACASGR